MSYLSSSIPGETLIPTYKKAFDATLPGGTLFVHDFMVENERTGPSLAALWALQHMVFTPGAESLTPASLEVRHETRTETEAARATRYFKSARPGLGCSF